MKTFKVVLYDKGICIRASVKAESYDEAVSVLKKMLKIED